MKIMKINSLQEKQLCPNFKNLFAQNTKITNPQ